MAIAINPDVRELDFSDNVKVSKFMQDFSDFRAKKWITYRPVNAPSESEPFFGGTRQFIINMGTGHILDTTYSGLWFTLYLENKSSILTWPLQASLPRTSTAWIESVTFQHSKVAAHIDERLCDYDAVAASFVPAKDVLSMKHTFFTTEGQTFADGNMFNEVIEDDPYFKLFPIGTVTTKRMNYAVRSFFIPLSRLSSIFNSGKYFFPSLLRGNGEMTLSIRSVHNSLSAIFGGEDSNMCIFAGLTEGDCLWSCDSAGENVNWMVAMTDMKLITLNLDNAFLTKEYNAFIASGRKFIRSFKGYNYQFYQVKQGYNRIEIANTHQSISHIILAFQTPYSVRSNGMPTSIIQNQFMGIQTTAAPGLSTNIYSQSTLLTQGAPPVTGGASSQFLQNASRNGAVVIGDSEYPTVLDETDIKNSNAPKAVVKDNILRSGSRKIGNIAAGAFKATSSFVRENLADILNTSGQVLNMVANNSTAPELQLVASGLALGATSVSRSLSANKSTKRTAQKETITPSQRQLLKATDSYDRTFDLGGNLKASRRVTLTAAGLQAAVDDYNQKTGSGVVLTEEVASHILRIMTANLNTTADKEIRERFDIVGGTKNMPAYTAALIAYMFGSNLAGENNEKLKAYLDKLHHDKTTLGSKELLALLANDQEEVSGYSIKKSRLGGQQLVDKSDAVAKAILDAILPVSLVEGEEDSQPFTENQRSAIMKIISRVFDDNRLLWHRYHTHMVPAEPKQIYDLGMNIIESLQVYRGTGNGETVFSEPINENMFYHVSREALGDVAENHPYFNYASFRKDTATITISLNTFMRDAHHEFWDGFSTNRVADRLYVEFEMIPLGIRALTQIMPWYREVGYNNNNGELNCKVFTVYDNIYYIDRDNNLNVSDTLLPLQEGRIPGSD